MVPTALERLLRSRGGSSDPHPRAPLCAAIARVAISPAQEPMQALAALRGRAEPWMLESALRGGPRGRHSFVGADPWLLLRAWGDCIEIDCRRALLPELACGHHRLRGDPLELVRALLPPPPEDAPEAIPFATGAVGWFGYELAERFEPVRLAAADDLALPDLALLFVDRVLAWDHVERSMVALGLGLAAERSEAQERARAAAREIAAAAAAGAPREPRRGAVGPGRPARASLGREDFTQGVGELLDEIAAGEVYQTCLTTRFEVDYAGDPWDLYCALRERSPAPFACYLELPEVTVVGSSPERFLRVWPDGRVESRPIKGTRPRGHGGDGDRRLRAELAASEKERAENLMIVDLVRNDLGRVCAIGSVGVPELLAIEDYARVFQMVSTVTGRLAPERDALDAVRAAFPPGSMTGAPKIAALRRIDRLEPVRRGIYSGSIGWLDARGAADLSVVIRTLLVRRGRAYLHAGAGIVADSDPESEWREALDKAGALLDALSACGARDAALLRAAGDATDAPAGCGMLGRGRGQARARRRTWDPCRESGSSRSRESDPGPSAG